ncbi:putative bifunctional diguanylate cyclase/phosphodiesterase [Leucothrix arctica]|uniref:GGDEF-domain containing protein n=1 Tax=Leucothrix arctica TaxID=1481894 RepID=A0A317C3F2_9GAMM|nr:EAL domain-containing protein [Leucothrix arctica]PWQ93108.1 hypothetical protein DKT75_20685 [Leucothrix arctica]
MRLNEFPVMQSRYVQLLRVIQCIHVFLSITVFAQSFSQSTPLAGFNINFFLDLGMVVVMQLLIAQVKKGRVALAVNIHQLITLFFLILMALMHGNLANPGVVAFPISLLLVSIYTRQANYLIYFSIVFLVVMGLGLNIHFGWLAVSNENLGTERSHLIRLLAVFSFTGFLSWTLVRDLKFAYTEQLKERERLKTAKKQIQQLADTDQLTGLLNRYGAKNKFDDLLKKTDFSRSSVLLLFFDIDDFKLINDQHGHHIGDEVLLVIGQRLQHSMNEDAVISRLGGDEFIIAFAHDSAFHLAEYLDCLLIEVAKPIRIESAAMEITSSIGVAVAGHPEYSFAELCRKADIAMYQAKEDGKNHYCHYCDDLEHAYMANLKLLQGMQEAVEKDGLALHYQPKINTATNQVIGAEALLRWEKYNPAAYTADQIIPVIETTNLIHEVGYWILRQACQDCKAWCDTGADYPVSVNISWRQLTDKNFASNVKQILDDVGLLPSSLMLEVAESALNQEGSDVMSQLQQVKAYGIKLAIDCFGVGPSNLAYLVDLDVDELKMDLGFTRKLNSSHKARSIVTAFVKMANQLGMQLVALGVEKEEDDRILRALGCVIEQGFLWNKPVPANELGQLVRY